MKRATVLICALLACLLSSPGAAKSATYRLDPLHCQVLFFVSHLGFSQQMGRFTGVSGQFEYDPDDWAAGSVQAQIAVDSLWLGDEPWQRKMLSDDFFDVGEHPLMKFVSERIEVTDPSNALVHGQLTLLGRTRPVVLQVTRNRVGRNTFNLKYTAGFSARATIKRSDFGMIRLRPAVGDEIEIRLEIEAIRE